MSRANNSHSALLDHFAKTQVIWVAELRKKQHSLGLVQLTSSTPTGWERQTKLGTLLCTV
jgi:hypothetical protein